MTEVAQSVLLVEDEPLIRVNYIDFLTESGFVVYSAETVKVAKNAVNGQLFDLIVLDHDLPDGKGSDVIDYLAINDIAVPVIFLSALKSGVAEDLLLLSRSVVEVLKKPVSPQLLTEKVQHWIAPSSFDELHPRLIGDEERMFILNNI